jgi:hypothetical protein
MRIIPYKTRARIGAKVFRAVHSLAAKGFGPANSLLHLKGKAIFDIGTIPDCADKSISIIKPCGQTRIAPNFGTGAMPAEASTHPELKAHILRDAVISTNSNQLLTKGAVLMPQQRFNERLRIPSNCDQFGMFNARYAVCDTRRHENYNKAILIGGDGACNWYHFVLECASKAYLLRFLPEEYKDYPVILPIEALTIDSYITVARALLPNRVFLSPEQGTAKVRKLVVLDEVSQGPFNLYAGHWPTVADYWQHEDTLLAMFSELRSALLPPGTPVDQSRRIFIVRPETRRNYNQAALLEIGQKYGFEPVSPETMPLAAQAQMYAEASHIIGASGAAWTNMIFAPKPFKAVTWLPEQYSEFCSYAMLANLLGHDLRYLISQPEWEIKSTSDAYVAPYQVPLPEFEAAVAHMCREN